MSRLWRLPPFLTPWILLAGFSALASAASSAPVLELDIPARQGALGAGVADSGAQGIGSNPAGLSRATDTQAALSYLLDGEWFHYTQLDVVAPDRFAGVWSGRAMLAGTTDWEEIDSRGQPAGMIRYYDFLLQVGYARSLAPGISAGLALTALQRQLAETSFLGATADAGLRCEVPNSPLALGAVIRNFGREKAGNTDGEALSGEAALGLSLTAPAFGRQRWVWLADMAKSLQPSAPAIRLGLEYAWDNTLFVRAGYRWENALGPLACGLGARLAGWGLDYAFQPVDFFGPRHRITVSYLLPGAPPAPTPSLPQAGPAPPPSLPDAVQARELKLPIRAFESQLVFKIPVLTAAVREWHWEIRDADGKVVKTFAGQGTPPHELAWDGRNESGNSVRLGGNYHFNFVADEKSVAGLEMAGLAPVFKLSFEKGDTLAAEAIFTFWRRPALQAWRLSILDTALPEPVRILAGTGSLPETLVWDGRDAAGKFPTSQENYRYKLELTYPDGNTLVLADKIRPIPARRADSDPGTEAFQITNIHFDFNSDQIKLDMLDKIQAAAGLLKQYAGRAEAVCEGFADDVGGEKYNLDLSRRRASMAQELLTRELGSEKIKVGVAGFGTRRPVSTGTDDLSRQLNRRVEIRIILSR